MSAKIGAKPTLTELPYYGRQLIVVTDDAVAEATSNAEATLSQSAQGIDWTKIAEIAFDALLPPLGRLVLGISKEVIKAWARARSAGINVLAVGTSQARELRFPPGHPRENVVYIGHPALPNTYYTMADFHRIVFEHKFCEATELLMSLGARRIQVEHVKGWSKDFSARISAPLGSPDKSLDANANSSAKTATRLLFSATLSGKHKPAVPTDLVWFAHEPTWQSIAKGRLHFGLNDFSLSMSYEDDFGVNAELKASIGKAGLGMGGKFEDHQSTIWRLEGEFQPVE